MSSKPAHHHSYDRQVKTLVVESARQEEVDFVLHAAPRRQNTPPPRTRAGVPLDPRPSWVEAVTVGYVAAGVPLLGAPSLADSSAKAIDGSTLSFLLQHVLDVKRKEEEAEEAAVLAELVEQVATAEEEIDQLQRPSDRSDLTQLFNRCCRWYLARRAVLERKVPKKKRKKMRRKRMRRMRARCCRWLTRQPGGSGTLLSLMSLTVLLVFWFFVPAMHVVIQTGLFLFASRLDGVVLDSGVVVSFSCAHGSA